jgi:LPPG:FO 2-phospho-L-lactate transferase
MVRAVQPAEVTAIVNTGDDTLVHGLHVSPDLDTVTYTLAGLNDDQRGWGLRDETWKAMETLEQLGGETWFRLGDKDLATHLYRTGRLHAGATLSQVTREISSSLGVEAHLLPMSDDPVRTRLKLVGGPEISFQDYFVRRRHQDPVESVRIEGAGESQPSPGVIDAIVDANVVIVSPSNPIISVGPILAVPGIKEALVARREDVVAVSPIIAGAALKGPADRLLEELGYGSSALGVARVYTEFAGTLIIDEEDEALAPAVEQLAMRCVVAPTVMHSVEHAAQLAHTTLASSAGATR